MLKGLKDIPRISSFCLQLESIAPGTLKICVWNRGVLRNPFWETLSYRDVQTLKTSSESYSLHFQKLESFGFLFFCG